MEGISKGRDSYSNKWLQHEFYQSAIVLGIDLGLEGIGIYLRKGTKEIYAKTLLYDVPETKRLESRRLLRSARRCRKSRKTRLHRLHLLFKEFDLPWVDETILKRTDPFKLRYRSLEGELASKEALSICIRHLVTHRGFDYGNTEEGAFPWGDSESLKAVIEWMATAFISDSYYSELKQLVQQFEWKDQEIEDFSEALSSRRNWAKEHDIESVLRDYVSIKRNHLKEPARGHNFPRSMVWDHLMEICRKHEALIPNVELFLNKLGFRARNQKEKKKGIFWYNRKTPEEQALHWESKVKLCPLSTKLGLSPNEKCAFKGDLRIRMWHLLEFAATRKVEIIHPENGTATIPFNAEIIQQLLSFVEQHNQAIEENSPLPSIKDAKALIQASIAPKGSKIRIVPETKSDLNKHFFSQLKDILCPTISNRRSRASLCLESAKSLFGHATNSKKDFSPISIVSRLRSLGFYDWRRESHADYGLYPQVEFLMGRRIQKGKNRGALSSSCKGKLRQIFEELREQGVVEDKFHPDYCVIEVIGDPPRNTSDKKRILEDQKRRRSEREKLFELHAIEDSGIPSKRRRITLYAQQKGICPYTGASLPESPLDPTLEIDHIYPESRGGLSVNNNLALTFRAVNSKKDKMTPREAAERIDGWSWATMEKSTSDMRWGKHKRDIFGFQKDEKTSLPDFGNQTRMSQMARQLDAEISKWMELDDDPNEKAKRIGLPNGWLAAQARNSWLSDSSQEYKKVRSNQIHHLVDAAVISHIPPGPGLNNARYGGIFFDSIEFVSTGDKGIKARRFKLKALPGLGPNIKHWLEGDYDACPIEKHRSQSKTRPLGDSTFWRLVGDKLYQRKEFKKEDQKDAISIIATLESMGICKSLIPKESKIEDWLNKETESPLKLTNGTPIKSVWKSGAKGNFNSPIGWTANSDDEALKEIRSLDIKWDRFEFWVGFNTKSNTWEYQLRKIPDLTALKHIKRMGFNFSRDKRKIAPSIFQKKPKKPDTYETLRNLLNGAQLHPYSHRVATLSRGSVIKIWLNKNGEIAQNQNERFWSTFYAITALITSGRVKLTSILFKNIEETPFEKGVLEFSPSSKSVIAKIIGLPTPEKMAIQLNLKVPQPSDTSSSSIRRRKTISDSTRQTDLGI